MFFFIYFFPFFLFFSFWWGEFSVVGSGRVHQSVRPYVPPGEGGRDQGDTEGISLCLGRYVRSLTVRSLTARNELLMRLLYCFLSFHIIPYCSSYSPIISLFLLSLLSPTPIIPYSPSPSYSSSFRIPLISVSPLRVCGRCEERKDSGRHHHHRTQAQTSEDRVQ